MHVIPLAWLRRRGVPEDALLHVSIFVSAVLVVLLAPLLKFIPHFCLAQRLLHVPCPGCGITAGLLALSHFDVAQSWRANPASVCFAVFLIFTLTAQPLAMAYAASRRSVLTISKRMSQLVAVALFAVWVARLCQETIWHW